ncbi:unnamed protein product [Discosporangium mesarthrocarpum]
MFGLSIPLRLKIFQPSFSSVRQFSLHYVNWSTERMLRLNASVNHFSLVPADIRLGAHLVKTCTGTQCPRLKKASYQRGLMVSETTSHADTSETLGELPTEGGGIRRFYDTWDWQGHKINYRVEGPKGSPPVLLIHGFGASVGHFRKNFPVLVEEGYRVYAVDLLGFGASDKPKDVEYSLELWQEMLLSFVDDMSHTPGEQWVFMGNSIGGLLTLMLTEALQKEERVRGSVLFNTAGGLVSFRESELPFYLLPVMWFFNNVVFGDFFGPRFFANFRTEENVRGILKQVYVQDVVDDDLIDMLIAPSNDDGACDGGLNRGWRVMK